MKGVKLQPQSRSLEDDEQMQMKILYRKFCQCPEGMTGLLMNNARSGQEKLVQVEYVTNSGQNVSIMKCVGVTGLEHERTQFKNMDKDIC